MRRPVFPYLCSDGSRTVCLPWTDIDFLVLGNLKLLGQCSSRADRLCVNSRTHDIGKTGRRILRYSLVIELCGNVMFLKSLELLWNLIYNLVFNTLMIK